MTAMSPPKNCAVCGDKALGYNFSAVTCESCKAFFRRNALAKKQFTCPFTQNCEITIVTRRFCQKCRLKKCLDIGMKSENIMSEEDKMIKRRKIEDNRAKRRIKETKTDGDEADDGDSKANCEGAVADSSSHMDVYGNAYDSQSCGSGDSNSGAAGPSSSTIQANADRVRDVNPELMTSQEMIEFIVCDPDRASQAISKLMRTPKEALSTMEKIINSQKDALRLVSHLIDYPGDALKIISKIMNSPFNALTVFTKFMSSPTDGLEIISKIVSSPHDVVIFIKNLMQSPEDGLDIMNKFMNTPAEALRMLNRIFNGTNSAGSTASSATPHSNGVDDKTPQQIETKLSKAQYEQPNADPKLSMRAETVIQMLNSSSPSDSVHIIGGGGGGGGVSLTGLIDVTAPNSPPTLVQLQSPQSHATTLGDFMTPTASPASYAHASPLSTVDSLQYQSPSTSQMPDELPSTSHSGGKTAPYITNSSDFDFKTIMQTHYNDETTIDSDMSINSLESVLSEVIRIEYQGFNSLQACSRIKEEQHLNVTGNNNYVIGGGANGTYSGGCNAQRQPHLQYQQQPICAPSTIVMERDLNEAEKMKLRELRVASEALYDPVEEDLSVLMMGDERIKPEDARHNPKLLQLINLTAVAIKRLIKMAKKISAFRDMCQEDQVALLKGGCTEMMIMRSAMIYDDNRNAWKVPTTKENMGNIRAELLKFAENNVYEEHMKFISTFDEKWRMDENIILIMCAIVLFTPHRPRIIHKDVIRLEQNSYYYLLRRYLESVYPGCEAKNAFIKLIQKISDVERLNKFIINVYLNVNPSQVEPLLREIFDLKNH